MDISKDNFPKKVGELYIKYDKNNQPEYGFLVDGMSITKFIPYVEKLPEFVFLPRIFNDDKQIDYNIDDSLYSVNEVVKATLINKNQTYLRGQVRIKKDCFKGFKDLNLVKSTTASLAIDKNAFDLDANVSFIVPDNFVLKNVIIENDISREIFSIILDKKVLDCISSYIDFPSERYKVEDFNRTVIENETLPNIVVEQSPLLNKGAAKKTVRVGAKSKPKTKTEKKIEENVEKSM